MKNKQKFTNHTLERATNSNSSNYDMVEQVVEEAIVREPKKRRKA